MRLRIIVSMIATIGCLSAFGGLDSISLLQQKATIDTLPPVDTTDALTLAMQMEKASIEHYQSLEISTPVKEFHAIYRLLVRDEQKHFHLLETWKKDLSFDAAMPTDILQRAGKLMSEFPIDTIVAEFTEDSTGSLLHVLNDDCELEKKSVSLYEDAMNRTATSGHGAIFTFLAKEEQRHVRLLEQLIECVKQPEQYLRSKEFNQLEKEVNRQK